MLYEDPANPPVRIRRFDAKAGGDIIGREEMAVRQRPDGWHHCRRITRSH